MPKSVNEIVKQEEVFDYEVFDLSDGRRVGVSADMSCGKPVLTVKELEPAEPKREKTVEEIVYEIESRMSYERDKLKRINTEGHRSILAAIAALQSLLDWIQPDAKEGNDDDR